MASANFVTRFRSTAFIVLSLSPTLAAYPGADAAACTVSCCSGSPYRDVEPFQLFSAWPAWSASCCHASQPELSPVVERFVPCSPSQPSSAVVDAPSVAYSRPSRVSTTGRGVVASFVSHHPARAYLPISKSESQSSSRGNYPLVIQSSVCWRGLSPRREFTSRSFRIRLAGREEPNPFIVVVRFPLNAPL